MDFLIFFISFVTSYVLIVSFSLISHKFLVGKLIFVGFLYCTPKILLILAFCNGNDLTTTNNNNGSFNEIIWMLLQFSLFLVVEDGLNYIIFRSFFTLTKRHLNQKLFFLDIFEMLLSEVIFSFVLLLFQLSSQSAFILILFSTLKAFELHIDPLPFRLLSLLPMTLSADYHSFFHQFSTGNFSQTFLYLDYLFETILPYTKYRQIQHDQKLLSINKSLYYTPSELREIRVGKPLQMGLSTTPKYAYIITGGNGQVGRFLLKRLISEGARKVTSIDIALPSPSDRLPSVNYIQCSILDLPSLKTAFSDHDILIHTAALVGVHHPKKAYEEVNVKGTLNVIAACKHAGVKAMVLCSSTCTRIYTRSVRGDHSRDMQYREGQEWEHEYARTKALGEMAVLKANGEGGLRTCSVAPHHIYGEEDQVSFLKIIEETRKGMTRVMGDGENIYSFVYVGNVAYALHLAGNALMGKDFGDCAGKFYVVSDGPGRNFWDSIDEAMRYLGFPTIKGKVPVGKRMIMAIGGAAEILGWALGRNLTLNRFVANRVVSDFYFSIQDIQKDIGYEAIYSHEEKWCESAKKVYEKYVLGGK